MAANDYYHPQDQHLYNNAYSREDAPLPPSAHTYRPYDQDTYHPDTYHPYGEDTGYHGASTHDGRPTDPFADQNAIPLHAQQPKNDGSPMRYNADPEYQYGAAAAMPGKGGRRRPRGKKGWFKGPITWVVFTLTIVQIGVFIGEIVKNATLTGSPIEIHPTFNPMIGPSPYVYITMGARYVPCMRQMGSKYEANITADVAFPCPNTTTAVSECSLSEACGMTGVPTADSDGELHPNQWYRFITPIFLHAGIIHIVFNLLVQMTIGRDIEILVGSVRFFLLYFASGIFGNVLGANYAANGMASVGASGAILGLIAITLLDLLYSWKERESPKKELLFILLDIVIGFIIGLLPGVDNFAHIGGFLMGIGVGIAILRSPGPLRERTGMDDPPYAPVSTVKHDGTEQGMESIKAFAKQPLGFFKGRKPLWWAWWLFRAGCLVAVIVGFIVLLNNFYIYRTHCSWCRYLSCLPVKNWCDIGYITLDTTNNSKRDLLFAAREMSPLDLTPYF
ncbi:rhomboid-domain-containing protein [Saccharata proteae CBS 121410]|uniref:Rhomboid-type serine protease n=1 Tax=Saccharata proteae CBS 121410 TaxID=1314787 RepID=A0A9P4LWP9_9PEZI|nr:rhomboid-domain-containing protein [Saccharata proteae CBS 121410]